MKRLVDWFLEEVRLMRAQSWDREDMRVAQAEPEAMPCTAADPKCAELIRKQNECRERMRRMKSGLLDGSPEDRPYTRGADVEATFNRARAIVAGPVRAVPSRKAAR